MADTWKQFGTAPQQVPTAEGDDEPTLRRKRRGGSDPGSPRTAADLELLLPDGRRFALSSTITIGRAPDNTVVLKDGYVSRHHCRIAVIGKRLAIENLSQKALWIDDARSEGGWIFEGSVITVGQTDLRVVARKLPG